LTPPKLVLAVIDGLAPAALERGVADGRAPTLAALLERGTYIDRCISAFPSVTPVCTASIITGTGPDEHRVPAMCWYLRSEERYVDYGSSFQATRAFGIGRCLTDTIYNLNLAHLSRRTPTLFELLDDNDVRTAGTTFLMYRGRHRHEATGETALARLVTATLFRHAVWGPRELFYADLFASRETGCSSQLGLPGARDDHSGCVGSFLIEHDLCDFLLLSLPDNDSHSHRTGPEGQVDSLALADHQLARVVDAGGGLDAFLEEHALIVMADHSHSDIAARISMQDGFRDLEVLVPNDPGPEDAQIALCPGWRSAMVYALDRERPERVIRAAERAARRVTGVDLVMRRVGDEAVVWSERGELRFAPGSGPQDLDGRHWSFEGELGAVGARVEDGVLRSDDYPDPLARVWSALHCDNAGELLISAAPGYEFTDWGGVDHVGGGSHGSLHRVDSHGTLILAGAGLADADAREQWTLRDIAPLVREHFGL
jgi:type I phosphodiesterase/nucleotide pyrophosphatase